MLDTIVSCKCSFCVYKDTVSCWNKTCASCIVDGTEPLSCINHSLCRKNEASRINIRCTRFVIKEWDL